MPGRKRKPALIKKLEGNRRKVGRGRIAEEPRGIGSPQAPDHLTEDERRLWAMACGSLPVGLLTRADEAVLERFAVAWARFRAATALIHKSGLMIQSPMGPIRNPLLVVQNIAAREMHASGSELGLSPAARARLTAPTSSDDDPMALLLGMDGDEDGAWSTLSTRTRQ